MKYIVTFQWSATDMGVYCTNIVEAYGADSVQAIYDYYQPEYHVVGIHIATDAEVETNLMKGMPYVKL